jgi:hypothetical protein
MHGLSKQCHPSNHQYVEDIKVEGKIEPFFLGSVEINEEEKAINK